MKRRLLPAIAATALLIGITACRTASPFRNVALVAVGANGACESLAVLHEEELCDTDTLLGVQDENQNLHLLRKELDTLPKIGRLIVSPDKEHVIIESWGEGHQYLSIYSVQSLVDATQNRGDTGVQQALLLPFRTLDPYPAAITEIRWASPAIVQFAADGGSNYGQFDKESRRAPYDEDDGQMVKPVRTWQWSLDDDTFREIP